MNILDLVNEHFGFLVADRGYEMLSHLYDSTAFGNFIVIYRRGDIWLKLIRDRSQIFVEFSNDGELWKDKESILEAQGISKERYSIDDMNLWSGYEIENQGVDLRKHLDLIEKNIISEGAA
jgi:hypothetical protein